MKFARPRLKVYLVIRSQEDGDFWTDEFDSYEEALAFVEKIYEKALIIGPEGVEDHT